MRLELTEMKLARETLMQETPPSDRIGDPWGARTPYDRDGEWPVRVDEYYAKGVSPELVQRWLPTASLLHSNGDAMDIAVIDDRIVGVRGRAGDRVNRGRLDMKDLYGWQANHAGDRLTTPLIRRDGELVPADWDSAMTAVVDRSRQLLEQRGPGCLGFYTTGQLFAEEYYTLTTIARAGIGTDHLDGNTRLCTATAGEALKETFGSDGQPASYTDVDHADVIALFGHNVAETQPVLWMRILDRLAGPRPPKLLVVDPRRTPVAERATVHLAPRPGTNLALMNALLQELIAHDWGDRAWLERHTVGFDELAAQVADCTTEWAASICGMDAGDIAHAAEMVGTTDRLLATVLQGFYQSHQATAAAVQVNNLVLLRGMLGRPGCGVLQMNGQPTAQNTRECGANGDLPGFRNWENVEHVAQLGEIWNVETLQIPHYAPPTHAMQIFRYAEQGSIKFLWISGTNPAVSLPELAGFTDKDGRPLISWFDPESAFDAWKQCSAGRPCDYTGLTYDLLRQRGGIQWPCTAQAPGGTERLYTDGRFWAAPEECESYGRDLITGASVEETEYRALNPFGKAILKAAEYLPPHEDISDDYPTQLITGRTIYHFHTRTKTARTPELQAAAPHVWVEISAEDARRLNVDQGALLDITSPRGRIRAAARISEIRPGVVFVPFHYGYWDTPGPTQPGPGVPGTAANELTITDWDPVSKQPLFKMSACRLQVASPDAVSAR